MPRREKWRPEGECPPFEETSARREGAQRREKARGSVRDGARYAHIVKGEKEAGAGRYPSEAARRRWKLACAAPSSRAVIPGAIATVGASWTFKNEVKERGLCSISI